MLGNLADVLRGKIRNAEKIALQILRIQQIHRYRASNNNNSSLWRVYFRIFTVPSICLLLCRVLVSIFHCRKRTLKDTVQGWVVHGSSPFIEKKFIEGSRCIRL